MNKVIHYTPSRQTVRARMVRRVFWYFAVLGSGLAAIGAAYVVLYSDIFRVQQIRVEGNQRMSAETVMLLVQQYSEPALWQHIIGPHNLLRW